MTDSIVPFGAQAPRPTYTVKIDPATFTYDEDRQVNVMADGRLWAEEPIAASSTATNNDSNGPADETSDPYAFPEPEADNAPSANLLVKAV